MKNLLKFLDEFAYDVLKGLNPISIILVLLLLLVGSLIGIELGR